MLVFDFEDSAIKLESDFLIRVRHFVSDELRYPVLRVLLSPVMLFDKTTIVPRVYIDFGECMEINEEFHLKIEVAFDETVLSNSFMNISSILKAQGISMTGETVPVDGLIHQEERQGENEHLFSIDGDESGEDKSELIKVAKIEKLIALNVSEKEASETNLVEVKNTKNVEQLEGEEDDDDDDYLKSLENRV